MNPENIFNICSNIALVSWIVLILSPLWRNADKFIIGVIITLFCIVYLWLIVSGFNFSGFQKFSSLNGVMQLFTNPAMVTAGWVHYLAFDLMTGLFICRNAKLHKINHWIIVPCLLLTFMLGPVGLLLYFIIRLIVTKKYFAANF